MLYALYDVPKFLPRGRIRDQREPIRDCDQNLPADQFSFLLLRELLPKRWDIETSF